MKNVAAISGRKRIFLPAVREGRPEALRLKPSTTSLTLRLWLRGPLALRCMLVNLTDSAQGSKELRSPARALGYRHSNICTRERPPEPSRRGTAGFRDKDRC